MFPRQQITASRSIASVAFSSDRAAAPVRTAVLARGDRQPSGAHLIDVHLPPNGTPTQPVAAGYMANAWLRIRYENYAR